MGILSTIGIVLAALVGAGVLFVAGVWLYIWYQQKKGRNPFM